MSIFMLNTESVTAAAETLNSITTEVDNILSNVNGYDTSNDDSFDFETPRSKIASNIEACKTKITNTMNAFNSVDSSHTNLQNKLTFITKGSEEELNDPGKRQQGNGLGNYMYNGYSGYSGYSQEGLNPNEEMNLFLTPFFLNLIANKLFNIINEEDLEEELKNKTTLVIRASQKTEKGAAYIEMATKIAMQYKIPVTYIDLDETNSNDKIPSISLVKNGEVLKTFSEYQDQETIEEMFKNNQSILNENTNQNNQPGNTGENNNSNTDSESQENNSNDETDSKSFNNKLYETI